MAQLNFGGTEENVVTRDGVPVIESTGSIKK
jgi:hypothetical protein